ncbi:MAG: aspartate kinase [Sedimentisphaerales bacterium]|nr:aspartate kinase [Sedimentisphaerales bacterium]
MKVCKFGGTSVADASQISKVVQIIQSDPERRIVVVSAPGKRNPSDTKVTDMLIALAKAAMEARPFEDELRAVVERFGQIQRAFGLDGTLTNQIEQDLRSRLAGNKQDKMVFLDMIKAAGEDYCARLVAEVLKTKGIAARYVNPRDAGLLLSNDFGNAQVLPESYQNLAALRQIGQVIVFPGFFGYTRDGRLATFPRGGSDITGSILAAAVKADLYENFTDVDCVYAVDPRIVPDAPPIRVLTYREMRELSYTGFGVFHDEAVVPAVKAAVPICLKNTNNPTSPGTMIVPRRDYRHGEVTGIASAGGFSTIYIGKYMMNRQIGFGRRLLQILEDNRLSFEHVPSGIDNMSVILKTGGLKGSVEQQVLQRIKKELEPDELSVEHDLALIMVVGEGMRYAVGLAARACGALAASGVNIEMINQGASEISIMFGVKQADQIKAVRALSKALLGVGNP